MSEKQETAVDAAKEEKSETTEVVAAEKAIEVAPAVEVKAEATEEVKTEATEAVTAEEPKAETPVEAAPAEEAAVTADEAKAETPAEAAPAEPEEPEEPEEISYHAVEKEGEITAIWEMQGRKHIRTISARSGEGEKILSLFTSEIHETDSPAMSNATN